jgi:putative ABC transport system permease protein
MRPGRWLFTIPLRLRSLFRRAQADQELDEELRDHVEGKTEEYVATGLPRAEARRQALLEIGGIEKRKEECRDTRGVTWLQDLVQDLRYGLRMLRKSPGFTAVAVLTLALGIGANTAIFSIIDAVLLRPLPIHGPSRVVVIHDQFTKMGLPSIPVSAPDFVALSRRTDIFSNTAVLAGGNVNLTGAGRAERLEVLNVSSGFFPLMGVKPLQGRWFYPSEDRPGANNVVVVSEALWKRVFSSDPRLIGKSMTMDGEDYTVVGIMPSSFQLPQLKTDLWTPLALTTAQLNSATEHGHQWLYMLARLQPGVTIAQAQAAMNVISRRFMQQYKIPPDIGYGIVVVQLLTDLIGDTGKFLFVLLAAIGFVLLIACANIANLTLARASKRLREIAVRSALGASRLRIVRQLFTESIVLALLGGGLGLWLAVGGVQLLRAVGPEDVPRLHQAGIDMWVLAFTGAVVLVTGVLFGLAPAFESSKINLHESLKEGGRSGSESAGRHRFRSLLVIGEVALTLVLLTGSALMVKSFIRLLDANPGFDPHKVLTMQISLPSQRYSKQSQITEFYQSLLGRVARLPGVVAAGAVQVLPFSGKLNAGDLNVEGRTYRPAESPHPIISAVMPGYFHAMQIPVREGRVFSASDLSESASRVVIVDEALAKIAWPHSDPIEKRVSFDGNSWFTVVGVVGSVKIRGFTGPQKGTLYFPRPTSYMSLVIRTASAGLPIVQAVRQAVASIDAQQPVFGIEKMEQYVSGSFSDQRLAAFLLAMFASLALLLAVIGIYGVMSYSVTQRTHEIGVRVALGAQRTDVVRLVLEQGAKLALVGVGTGALAALVLTRLLGSLLYDVKPTDPLTFILVSLFLTAVALLACYIPARRAMRVDPMVALRYE